MAIALSTACAFPWSALATVLAAGIAVGAAIMQRRHEKFAASEESHRELLSNAYRAVLGWQEMVYRVRRRPSDGSFDYALVEQFHRMQEEITYFRGWVSAESAELGRSFDAFLNGVREACKPLLQEAWSKAGRAPTESRPGDEAPPDVTRFMHAFERDMREYLHAHGARARKSANMKIGERYARPKEEENET